MSKPIFISHAAVDKDIADAVLDLLNTAMNIDVTADVFCSSIAETGITPGADFTQFIKEQIQTPKIVLLLISHNYLASQFCLAEVGACWAKSHEIVPLLVEPAGFADMKAVLQGKQALKIDDKDHWNVVLETFKTILGINPNIHRWERKRDEVITRIKALIPKQKPPAIVSMARYTDLEAKLSDANKEVTELEEKVRELTIVNEKLKALKDAEEVAQVELENLPDAETLKTLGSAARKSLDNLPPVVRAALFHHFRDEELPSPEAREDGKRQDIEAAARRELLRDADDGGAKVNEDDPRIKRAIDALSAFRNFVKTASPDLSHA
jgi:TIR domain-containing protein